MILPEGRIFLITAHYAVLIPIMILSYFVKIKEIATDFNATLYQSLRSESFNDATLLGVGISVHLIVHLLLETLVSVRVPKRHMFTRWCISLAYALTNLLIWITLRFDSIDGRTYLILQSVMMSVIICSHCCSMNIICENLWNRWVCVAIPAFVCLYFSISYQDEHFCNFHSTLGVLAFISMVLGALISIQTSYYWCKKYLHKKHLSDLDINEKITFARMGFIVGFFIIFFIFMANNQNLRFDEVDAKVITLISYGISLFVILFSVSYARKWHAEASEVAVCVIFPICIQRDRDSPYCPLHVLLFLI